MAFPAGSTRVGGPPLREKSTASVDPVSKTVGTQRRWASRATCQHIVDEPVVSMLTPDEPGCERAVSDEVEPAAGRAGVGTVPDVGMESPGATPESANAAVG
jgi:hypothetical protein